jgi:hypothetical protein
LVLVFVNEYLNVDGIVPGSHLRVRLRVRVRVRVVCTCL